jgi:GNAT superfamily N-acetyltransferase
VTDQAPAPFDKSKHERSEFSCGEESLDRWLKEQAGQAQKKDATRTYVVADEHDRIIGYYSLCAFSVKTEGAPPAMKVGRYPIPAVLLARLAVQEREQGSGLGASLLLDAFSVAASVADAIGARMLVVHALHEKAARYYEANGFKAFEQDPLTLYLPMQDIRESLRVAHEG